MSVIIYAAYVNDDQDWEFLVRSGVQYSHSTIMRNPYPSLNGVSLQYRQKCRDTVTGLWTEWTTNFEDRYGSEYPLSGFDSSTYRVVGIVYDRAQE